MLRRLLTTARPLRGAEAGEVRTAEAAVAVGILLQAVITAAEGHDLIFPQPLRLT
ncbi:MAG: hypothetical protein JO097_19135 [Acidobacteriaceae bacterium]|nr:hypothetical protein [Acidobacteriaceae bacterium]